MASGTISCPSSRLLWTGNFTSGSITVPGADKYSIFEFLLEGQIPCFGTASWGAGGYLEYAANTVVHCGYRLSFTINGEDITFSINSYDKGGAINGNHVPIVAIRGIT